ncbi:Amino acid transporter AVT1J [Sesamum angolense]|uniref:Amino acid transporter AVT1J n=1 Tax=Sesamum angolense TaxID=2727404 RepID=A0AAE1X0I2_9LAMI|nr:Amino acid transporter AVT1J [Sesamum angolense]
MDSNNIEKLESQRHPHPPQPPNKGTTFITTCFNGLNALTGIGILSIPYALSEGGWTSLTALFMICLVCLYTGLLLKRKHDKRGEQNTGLFASNSFSENVDAKIWKELMQVIAFQYKKLDCKQEQLKIHENGYDGSSFRPNACSPMSGYVLMRGFVYMHLFRSKPVYKQTRHIMKRAVKDVQPPSDSVYEIDSMPMPANTRIVLIEGSAKVIRAWLKSWLQDKLAGGSYESGGGTYAAAKAVATDYMKRGAGRVVVRGVLPRQATLCNLSIAITFVVTLCLHFKFVEWMILNYLRQI